MTMMTTMAMAMVTAMAPITMMPPPKAAPMMTVVVPALLLVVGAEGGERPQIPVRPMPQEMVYRDGR